MKIEDHGYIRIAFRGKDKVLAIYYETNNALSIWLYNGWIVYNGRNRNTKESVSWR